MCWHLEGEPLWWLGHEVGALMNGISALIKEAPESPFTPSTIWGHSDSPNIKFVIALMLNLPSSGTKKQISICKSFSLWYSATAVKTD